MFMSVMGCADGGTGAVEEEERLDLAGVLATRAAGFIVRGFAF